MPCKVAKNTLKQGLGLRRVTMRFSSAQVLAACLHQATACPMSCEAHSFADNIMLPLPPCMATTQVFEATLSAVAVAGCALIIALWCVPGP